MQQVHEAQSAYGDAKKSLAILFEKPDDPDANLKFGKYRCFIKSDWKSGLPMLAHGNDPALKSLAAEEIAGTNAADDPYTNAPMPGGTSQTNSPAWPNNPSATTPRTYAPTEPSPRPEGLARTKSSSA